MKMTAVPAARVCRCGKPSSSPIATVPTTPSGFVNGINGDIVGTPTNPADPMLSPLQDSAPAQGFGDSESAITGQVSSDDLLQGGEGDDTAVDPVAHGSNDGWNPVNQFRTGPGGDRLSFEGLEMLDVGSGGNPLLHISEPVPNLHVPALLEVNPGPDM